LEGLPESQRIVVTMRDVEGLQAEDVCMALGLSTGNQRVLLHRGRARVRACLSAHLGGLS
jgi:RNA polymerase sigma-70 factor (ECF subfamily)